MLISEIQRLGLPQIEYSIHVSSTSKRASGTSHVNRSGSNNRMKRDATDSSSSNRSQDAPSPTRTVMNIGAPATSRSRILINVVGTSSSGTCNGDAAHQNPPAGGSPGRCRSSKAPTSARASRDSNSSRIRRLGSTPMAWIPRLANSPRCAPMLEPVSTAGYPAMTRARNASSAREKSLRSIRAETASANRTR